MSQKFISLEMIAQIEQSAQNGCLYSQTQLEILGMWKPSPNKPEDCFGFESLDNEIAESFGHPVDNWSGLTY